MTYIKAPKNNLLSEHALQEMEYIITRSPVIVFLWKAAEQWPVEFVSENVAQFGYTPEDFYTQRVRFAEIIHPDDLERVAAEVNQYSHEAERTDFEQHYRLITKAGEIRWIEDCTWIRRDRTGVITHYQGIVMDITARQQAEEALRHKTRELNKRVRELNCLYRLAELMGHSDQTSLQEIFQESVLLIPYVWEHPHKICARLSVEDHVFITPNYQETVWKQTSAIVAFNNRVGNLEVGYLAENSDAPSEPLSKEKKNLLKAITERLGQIIEHKQAEDAKTIRLRYEAGLSACSRTLLADSLRTDVLTTAIRHLLKASDASRVYIFENFEDPVDGLCCRQTHEVCADGIASELGNPLLQHLLYRDLGTFQETLSQGNYFGGIVASLPQYDREILEPQGILALLILPIWVNGQWYGYIGFDDCVAARQWADEDIRLLQTAADMLGTSIERKQAEEALQHAKEAADAANRAKSQFLANISHEIRTPMNAILGFTDLLDGLISDPRQKNYLEAIKTGGKNLLTLINDILDLSKIEAGKMDIRPEPIDLKRIVHEVSRIFQQRLAEKKLEFVVEMAPELPEGVWLDEVRLRQVLFNLIGNAIKFTEQGQVTLRVSSIGNWQLPIANCQLQFEIQDTGIGIPEDQQELIFEAFHQQDGQLARKYGGTGLGLTITKRLVEIMGGTITLRSSVGMGSTFTIVLGDVPIVGAYGVALKSDPVETQRFVFEPATVLVVDDISHNRDLVKAYLHDTNLRVLEAENGEQAVLLTQQQHPDLILMDLRMPLMDGYETTKRIREWEGGNTIPIIALTAFAMQHHEDASKTQCFDGYVYKPIHRMTLFREIARFLAHTLHPISSSSPEGMPSPAPISPEPLEQLSELLARLEHEGLSLWKTAQQSGSFDEIEKFGEYIHTLAGSYPFELLREFGERVLRHVRNFDVDNLLRTLDTYPHVLQQIKEGCCNARE